MINNPFRSVNLFSLVLIGMIFSLSIGVLISPGNAQTVNDDNSDVVIFDENILSGDLANNPVAQDILKKIEQTKRWIAELEERNYEQLEKQKELDEKRLQALESLENDLKEWELLWEFYSPRNSFERFVDTVPNFQVKEVFWDQFEFKEQKVKAGRAALKEVISNGGSLEQARQAYLVAAETKRIELIEANSQFNVRHNLAYYNQQVLFDREGQIVDSPVTGEQLRKYYEDFRTNPVYLKANPNDVTSWEDLGRTNENTECREGYIVVHRFHAQDYVCVTINTAEMWIRHGMGEILGTSPSLPSQNQQKVTPLSNCDEDFRVVYNIETLKYSCVQESTAEDWVEQGIGEIHDPEVYILQSIEQKENTVLVEEINLQIIDIQNEFDEKLSELKDNYDKKYKVVEDELKVAERELVVKYNEEGSELSKEELSSKIIILRDRFESKKENVLEDKIEDAEKLGLQYEKKMIKFIEKYESEPYVEFVTKSGPLHYKAFLRE